MAIKKDKEIGNIEPLTIEEIQRQTAALNLKIAETEFETKSLALEEQRETNQRTQAIRARRILTGEQKQQELKRKRLNQAATVRACRHKMGGKPENPFKGDGKSCIKVSRMPDGKTYLLQCGRCPLQIMTPHLNLKKRDRKLYDLRVEEFAKLIEEAEDYGLDPIKGVTFNFSQNDLPLIPEASYEYRGLHPEREADTRTAA